jgi:hypothetical protein
MIADYRLHDRQTQSGTELATGGAAAPLPGDGLNQERYWPLFLPDGRHYVYFGRPQKYGIFVASIDSSPAKLLLSDYVGAAYAAPGIFVSASPP